MSAGDCLSSTSSSSLLRGQVVGQGAIDAAHPPPSLPFDPPPSPPSLHPLGPCSSNPLYVRPLASLAGTVVVLIGQDFGPVGAAAVTATYSGGSTGATFALDASRCEVVVAHTRIACTTLPGVGFGYQWRVTVANLTSTLSAFASTYATPQIQGLRASPTSAPINSVPTPGGSTIVRGVRTRRWSSLTFTALCAPRMWPLWVGAGGWGRPGEMSLCHYTTPCGRVPRGPLTRPALRLQIIDGQHFGVVGGVPVTAWYGSLGALQSSSYNATSCAVTVNNVEITCSSAQGVSTGLRVWVGVAGLTSPQSEASLAYAAPSITNIAPRVLTTEGGQSVVLVRSARFAATRAPCPKLCVCVRVWHSTLSCRTVYRGVVVFAAKTSLSMWYI
jgi:hypothetical protein